MAIEMAAGDMTRELLVVVGGVAVDVDVAEQDEASVGVRGDGAPGGVTL
jgi:hypothetical protein